MFFLVALCMKTPPPASVAKWFFGFKLHGVCTEDMTDESLMFTTGSVHDSRMAQEVTRDIVGRVFADAGYQLRKEDPLR